jgi:hypothetical protein
MLPCRGMDARASQSCPLDRQARLCGDLGHCRSQAIAIRAAHAGDGCGCARPLFELASQQKYESKLALLGTSNASQAVNFLPIRSRFESDHSLVNRAHDNGSNRTKRIEWRHGGAVVAAPVRSSGQAGDEDRDGERHDSPRCSHGDLLA